MQDINEVGDKVAIVTGAASGIGRAITDLLVARGAYVIAEDIDPAVESLAGPNVVPLVADICKHAAITSGFRLLGVRAYVSTIRKRTRAHYFPRHIGGPHTADL
ncbi:SDR family NAD(P)-dependent oxidoreductase [Caballeronia sp. LZ001]|uniref:SDR family NAD(P)-dependent oxidoreductase n=1 Tax=Caballeronia sp. LZ001 TaxID=3038553 RepID=UPI00285745E3|nr:SDR family NAD(P)-dependent oxidoreductase [Caballeronia sp. LZ001]MDR5806462.1 SDR family NAD(P)-dependent oxidoreductase [Caballeronia sp. LZ001]